MSGEMTKPKTLDYYLSLPYSIVLTPTEDGGWFAEIPDLPGCMTYGDTREEVLEMIDDVKLTWISGSLLAGDPIPEPRMG
jgi:antitoxin HicB